jgi:hypothetical protein
MLGVHDFEVKEHSLIEQMVDKAAIRGLSLADST